MILVTGATGLIGRSLVRQLVQREGRSNILCLAYNQDSALEREGRKILRDLGLAFLEVDLSSGEGLDKIPKSPDKIFHLASITDTSVQDHSINDAGTRNLLEAVMPLSPDAHWIFTSSIAVTDNRPDLSVPADETLLDPPRPSHKYGQTKRAAELYIMQKAREMGFRLSIVRVCGVYGEGVRAGGLFDSIKKLVGKGAYYTRLNWPGKISVIFVEDMARFLVRVSDQPPVSGQCELYVPSAEALTVEDMSQIIHQAYGLPYKGTRLPAFVWKVISYLAVNKQWFEKILPHKLYNKFWQLCILVNNEFWCRSSKIDRILPAGERTGFQQYYSQLTEKYFKESVMK